MRALPVVLLIAACGEGPSDGGTGGGAGGSEGKDGGGPSIDREELSGSRLKNRYIEGDDGSRTANGFFDVSRGEPCFFQLAEDGRQRCLPLFGDTFSALVTSNLFADASCTQALAQGNCAGATYAYSLTQTCPYGYTVFAASAFTSATMYQKSGTLCDAIPVNSKPNAVFFAVGAKVDASAFVAGTIKHD